MTELKDKIPRDAMHEYCKQLTEKANAKIAELEKRYNDLSGALRFKYGEWENLKAENEQLEKRLAEAEKERDELLALDNPYPLPDVIKLLIKAGKILLFTKNYSGIGYEDIGAAINRAEEILEQFKQQKK